ncbi:methyltransferase domain-containing protein [Candidatus Bathyarchaeota archaeon]|nr:methyltransferase domain-containing protein [Candidatus Bathyarchaeota archaeon]
MDEWEKKRDVMRRYDSSANVYDDCYSEEQNAKIDAAMKRLNMQKGFRLLDLGCGTGMSFCHVSNKAGAIVGLDISRKMLVHARKRTEVYHGVELVLADADNTPFKNNVFDLLLAVTLIQNAPNPLRTLKEAGRVLKTAAPLVVTGLKKKFSRAAFEKLLHNAGLEVIILKSDRLKCYVAVCTNSTRNTLSLKSKG